MLLTKSKEISNKFLGSFKEYALRENWQRVLPRVTSIFFLILIFLVLWNIVQLFWLQQSKVNFNAANQPKSSVLPITEIPQWHLFGIAPIENIVSEITNLPLKLNGVIIAPNTPDSRAIISTPDQTQKVYRINDSLPGGAILYSILPDGVIIKNNNHLERLPLEKSEATSEVSPDTATMTPTQNNPDIYNMIQQSPGMNFFLKNLMRHKATQ